MSGNKSGSLLETTSSSFVGEEVSGVGAGSDVLGESGTIGAGGVSCKASFCCGNAAHNASSHSIDLSL